MKRRYLAVDCPPLCDIRYEPIHPTPDVLRDATTVPRSDSTAVRAGFELQQRTTEAFLRSSLTAQRSALEQGTGIVEETTNAQLDVFESMFEEAETELRSAMDDQFEQNAGMIQQILNDQFDQGVNLIEQLLTAQFDTFASALWEGGFDVRALIDEQFDAFADSRNGAWSALEPTVLEVADSLGTQQRLLAVESTNSLLEAQQAIGANALNRRVE